MNDPQVDSALRELVVARTRIAELELALQSAVDSTASADGQAIRSKRRTWMETLRERMGAIVSIQSIIARPHTGWVIPLIEASNETSARKLLAMAELSQLENAALEANARYEMLNLQWTNEVRAAVKKAMEQERNVAIAIERSIEDEYEQRNEADRQRVENERLTTITKLRSDCARLFELLEQMGVTEDHARDYIRSKDIEANAQVQAAAQSQVSSKTDNQEPS